MKAKNEKKSSLIVGREGRIEGNARAANMTIEGTVIGDLDCSGVISLSSSAQVRGSIQYRNIQVQKGAVVTGRLINSGEKKDTSELDLPDAGLDRGKAKPASE